MRWDFLGVSFLLASNFFTCLLFYTVYIIVIYALLELSGMFKQIAKKFLVLLYRPLDWWTLAREVRVL